MKSLISIFAGIFFISLQIPVSGDDDKIIFVAGVLRHGARNMAFDHQYITNDTSFKDNPGKLTLIGKHQLYLLGEQLRYLYVTKAKLLSPYYNTNEITIISSGLNRTVESIQSFMSGFYSDSKGPSLRVTQEKRAIPPIKVE